MKSNLSRRKFLHNASLGISAGAIGLPGSLEQGVSKAEATAPRLVNIGTVSIMDMTATSTSDMIQQTLQVMEQMIPFRPDIICLPEVFAFTRIGSEHDVRKVAEKAPGPVISPFMKFAAAHKCYVICPTYTLHGGNIYISAVLIDRKGNVAGEYHKMRPTAGEMETGVKPGEADPPVFKTDFGTIGIQICFDIKFEEGWKTLKEKGAQIIFWPSAYAAGREISSRAWRHQVYVVSSTQKDTSKICDISGESIAGTNRWQRNWVCAPINLEKAFLMTWPAVSLFPDIQKKFGNRISLTTYGEEEWTIMESHDASLKVADVLKEFNLKTMHESLNDLAALYANAK
ncbi:MAG: carbon-nitrogen hydrolase family protein [Flavitalea sp.]